MGHSAESGPPPTLRDTLFGDLPIEVWGASEEAAEPWSRFARARQAIEGQNAAAAIAELREVIATPGLETRHYLQAWNFLRQLGLRPPPRESRRTLGVVLEVSVGGGLDLLAAYDDGSARYYHHAGAGVVWDRPDPSLDAAIAEVISAGQVIADLIGPWKGRRPEAPPPDHGRLNLLTPSGLMFGQGRMADLAADPLSGPLLSAGTVLMQSMIAKRELLTDQPTADAGDGDPPDDIGSGPA